MHPTIDGLSADQWFTVARIGAECLLLGVLVWMVGRYLRRAVRFLLDEWEAERLRRKAHADWLAERTRMATPSRRYVRGSRPAFTVIHNDD